MSKLKRVVEYLGKIIAKITSYGRYILQDMRVGKYYIEDSVYERSVYILNWGGADTMGLISPSTL